ncbi:MAG: PTS sugar transporter subunit IIA [Siculibacillus sp.]|nr:PTS sugar transporter subunit IIA [Siculibacillus sp.]
MTTIDPLRPEAVLLDVPARTKAHVLKALAGRFAEITGREPLAVSRALADREKLGSTGVGSGVALPHAAIEGISEPVALFARLARPLDWEAIDEQPVDLVVAVLSPTQSAGASLNVLSKFARMMRSEATRVRLRTGDRAAIVRALAGANDD